MEAIKNAMNKLGVTSKSTNAREELRTNPNVPLRDRESMVKLFDIMNSGKPYHEVLEYINHEITESTRVIEFNYEIDCFLSDGAYALSRAVENKIGYTKQSDEKGMSGNRPPKMIDIAFADGTHKKVPFGDVQLPVFGEEAHLKMQYHSGILYLSGQCEKRFVNDMDDIINRTKEILKTDSIYKGKAIKYVEGGEPEFINIGNVDKTPLFLTKEARFNTAPIEARIEKTELCLQKNIDLKYGVILEGTYGTGKSLYAFKIAKKAVDNGWMFLYVKDAKHTLDAMKVAQKYAHNGKGLVLFVEDIDVVLSERNAQTNEISLLLDGGESKNVPVITIFTTNHIEKIEPTFLRGKRIGSIISLGAPDKETALEILENSLADISGKRLFKGTLDKSAQLIADETIVPAFIAEIVERTKANMTFLGQEYCTDEDVVLSIKSYKNQIDVAQRRDVEPSDAEKLHGSITKLVKQSIEDLCNDPQTTMGCLVTSVDSIDERV